MRHIVFVFIGLTLFLFTSPAGAGSADEILERAGVRGGLIVHIGSGDGRLLADLSTQPGCLLHGLETDPVKVQASREFFLARGLYGKISVDLFDGHKLPYAENLVNLVVIDSPRINIPGREILRVLVPKGVALINGEKIIKPIPANIDEWSHFEHGPENNAVAADTVVGPPRHLHWVAGPRWLRTHEEPTGITSMVTAGGRLFYTLDEGPIGISDSRMPEKWALIARDAFNGTQLWKKHLPNWGWQTWRSEFKETYKGYNWIKTSGLRTKTPSSFLRRMVADSERLYFTLGNTAPVSIIDAANGKVIAVCKGSDDPKKLILCNGVLCVQLSKAIVAYNALDGSELWKKELPILDEFAAHGRSLLYHTNKKELHCIDLKTVDPLWDAKLQVPGQLKISGDKVLLLWMTLSGRGTWATGSISIPAKNCRLWE